ncbi:interferon alpha-inducible protein 27-like protein 2A [Amphiprion ocellaris]|uniref:interferon alpha-inducible protein 27-like protein 2A n=1 Tax=Amphiprion ocellaris TaxID=80972 RepID=UPI0024113CA9|nr:interferon alpha-inducible protein 27-like protein 2A [Amphiprion ocellaris]
MICLALAPVALGAIDFTPAGIAASSYAAGILPYAAIVKYEEVAAKSLVDVLQSAVTAVAIAAGAGGAVVSAPFVLGAIGFTSAGIAAGSYAAGMMSTAAIANGGGVAAGSLVAILQSAGMAGLSGTATAAVASAGGTVGFLATLI